MTTNTATNTATHTTTIPATKMLSVAEAAELLLLNDQFLIYTHANPDGDTCGSAAALCAALRMHGKYAYVSPNSTITDRYLPYIAAYLPAEGTPAPSASISVDIADPSLFTEETKASAASILLCIDHHPSNKLFAANTLLQPKAAACGEIILDLVREMAVQHRITPSGSGEALTKEIALPLYLAIATDTGCFRFSNTTAGTLRAAADLLETGIDFIDINTRFFETKSRSRIQIERQLHDNLRYSDNGHIALAAISRQMVADTGAKEEDIENISSMIRSIEGVDIGILLRERGENVWKISVRTNETANASKICALLGGGGHARAAGCTVNGSEEEAAQAILHAIETEKAAHA